jgi:hypothetical protein
MTLSIARLYSVEWQDKLGSIWKEAVVASKGEDKFVPITPLLLVRKRTIPTERPPLA